MPTTQVNLDRDHYASFSFHGVDSTGVGAPVTGTVTIDNYDQAYVARQNTSGLNFVIVPKVLPSTASVQTARIHAVDANGTALPEFSVQAIFAAAPGAPLAVNVELMNDVGNVGVVDANTPPDPGSDSVSF